MAKKFVLPNNVGKGTGHMESRPVWINVQIINYQNKFAPTTIFTRFGRIPVSAAKPKAAASTSAATPVNTARLIQSVNFSKSRISVVKGHGVTAVKTLVHPQQALNNKGIVNSGCSRHITGNKAYLADYQEINDGGFVAFSSSKGKIIGKASIDKSNLWHRRLGHVNFKTMNKLVKGNLVRGLPSKIFENDHTCVAFQKGKQHKATCKAKLMSSISQPLQMLYMDLFGPTSVMSINHKKYCLVVTDDFSRALVKKSHNKTPYELLNGRTPRLDFMRPFGCPITILNTLDPLGKFEGKADEGFLVGYSVTSKAFRVFNTKTRKDKENLHVRFLENKPNVAGTGPNWLFDTDSLINSMNYIPVSAENQTDKNVGPQDTNGNAGTQDNVDAGKEVSDQHYIMLLLWSSISSTFKSLDDKAAYDKPKDDTGLKTIEEPVNKEDQAYKDELDRLLS
uniref:Ribonuclease H-like domain-containing protein n=1 Tax=Tanacetum cinerariifolium TaxID=118510 RepID=A0A699HCJ3_TANCI|nr:ribonuclease H-like domain-containing protein [Tanacetum cinerariifolium]